MSKMWRIICLLAIALIIISCSNPYKDYPVIEMAYQSNYVDIDQAYQDEHFYFEPLKGYLPVKKEELQIFRKKQIIDENAIVYEDLKQVYVDSLSQLIIISEIKSTKISDYDSLFAETKNHYKNMFQSELSEQIVKEMTYRYGHYLIHQSIIDVQNRIILKAIVSKISKRKLSQIYMIDFSIEKDQFAEIMRGVESSITSIDNKREGDKK